VVTTCSPSNFDYVKSLGADAAFDYGAPDVVDQIRAWSANPDELLTRAWDCISSETSAKICAGALSKTKPSLYRALLPVSANVVKQVNEKVDVAYTMAYTMFGEPYEKGARKEAVPEDYEFGKKFWEDSRVLLEKGIIKPARVDLNRGGKGLEGVLVGLDELRLGKVSGVKLVYTLEESA
jgi:NADPH:quinone reductase-like Zn-dependent oxidoreductase